MPGHKEEVKLNANTTRLPAKIRNYKKQRHYEVNLNKNIKFEYFTRYEGKDVKAF